MPFTTLGTSTAPQPVARTELHAAAAPSADTKVPRGTVWSAPVKVVTPATTPSFTAVGIFTETTTLKLPVAGASRYHISTRRVFPASLCAPTKLKGVPFHATDT